ncbi:MAG: hypothetical protein GPOALKHO_000077 [Sodalis sp.]|nr:MAG: hypothetical protein GPOALKHO_000077 [Sodalis sp.]
MIDTVVNREHQLGEHCGFPVFTQTSDAVAQYGLLNQSRFRVSARSRS